MSVLDNKITTHFPLEDYFSAFPGLVQKDYDRRAIYWFYYHPDRELVIRIKDYVDYNFQEVQIWLNGKYTFRSFSGHSLVIEFINPYILPYEQTK